MADENTARILIVEDEPDMNNLLADVLRAYGFEPVQAADADGPAPPAKDGRQ